MPRPELYKNPGIDIVDLAAKTIQPKWLVHAHWAVLGFTFIEKDYFPGAEGDLFFASHGSWNSTNNVGAVIQRVTFDQVTGLPYGSMTIVDCQDPTRTLSTGALQAAAGRGGARAGRQRDADAEAPIQGGSGRYARPVDLAEWPDGSLVFSSDEPPALYRLSNRSRSLMLSGSSRYRPVQSSFPPVVLELLESRRLLSGNLVPQTITVRVFLDRNSDHHRNCADPGLAGFHVTAKRLRDSNNGFVTETADTDAKGVARFTTYVDSQSNSPASASISLRATHNYRCLNCARSDRGIVAGIAAPLIEFAMVDYLTVSGAWSTPIPSVILPSAMDWPTGWFTTT